MEVPVQSSLKIPLIIFLCAVNLGRLLLNTRVCIFRSVIDASVVDIFGEGISDVHPRVCIGASLPTLYAGLTSILWGYYMGCQLPNMIFIHED